MHIAKIMGYKLSNDIRTKNATHALKMAVKSHKTTKQLIHHSDRWLQYCSGIYQTKLKKNNILPSMTDVYNCYQNALTERINGILKDEFLIHKGNTGKELDNIIAESIETYNNDSPHLSLNMKKPNFIHKKTCEAN